MSTKSLLRVSVLFAIGLFITACANQPIYDVSSHQIPVQARPLPLSRIESVIIEAGQSRGWRFERISLGKLRATQANQKLSAQVEINFDNTVFGIRYIASSGMKEANGTVHPHYNFWIRNLEHDIETWLANAPLSKP